MKNTILLIGLILVIGFLSSCKTSGARFTSVAPTADMATIRTVAFDNSVEWNDVLALRGVITQGLIKVGFTVIDSPMANDMSIDALVRFNYTHSSQFSARATWGQWGGLRAGSYQLVNNVTITFIDNVDGSIILTSSYPKAVYAQQVSKVVQVLIEDIRKAMASREI